MGEILSLIGSLIGVIGILVLTYFGTRWMTSKVGTTGVGSSKYMKIIDRLVVGQNKSIVIVDIQGKYYLVSITENNIELLKELDSLEINTEEYIKEELDFNKILTKFKKTY